MVDILTQNGLSIGTQALDSGTTIPFPSVVPPGSNPIDSINRAQIQLQRVETLQYPSDLPKYYTGFQIYRYHRENLLELGKMTLLNGLCLPLPDQMLDVNQVAYGRKEFSSFVGASVNAAFPIGNQISDNIASGKPWLSDVKKDDLKKLNTDSVVGAGLSAFNAGTGGAGDGILGAAGYSPNYFLTVVLDGPQYKQYSFTWTFAPRTPRESIDLRQITRVFQDAQAPGLALGGALFTFPRVFQNYFGPDRGLLYQFKPSVLTGFSVNMTPAGMPSMKQSGDPALQGMHAPTMVSVQASFLELEFWLRGDFGDPNGTGIQEISSTIRPESNMTARQQD